MSCSAMQMPQPDIMPQSQSTSRSIKSHTPAVCMPDLSRSQGRIKFLGTIVHPTNKYLTLSFSTTRKGGVACEDCFDNLVVFSDWYWVGKKSINPEERRLPLPMEMRDIKVHTNPNFQAGAIAGESHTQRYNNLLPSFRIPTIKCDRNLRLGLPVEVFPVV